jgi:hypothetical protein
MMRTAPCRPTTGPRPGSPDPATRRPRRRALAVAVGLSLTLAACSSGSSSSSDATPEPSGADTTVSPAWAQIDAGVAALGPDVGILVASVSDDGTCVPIHEVASTTARPTASQFKLFVLGALVDKIEAGDISWEQPLIVDADSKSLGNGDGSLQTVPPGTTVSVEDAATKMISISDNTAADMLIGVVGRDAVEAQAEKWMADASANDPFLTTREMFLLHYVPGLADRYLATPPDQRGAFLTSEVDPRPLGDVGAGLTADPSHIDTVEWFASPHDVCQAFAGLHQQATSASGAPLSIIMSVEQAGIDLDHSDWPTVWYKGGSEPGVLTLGWLATNGEGETFVVETMVANPDAALAQDSIAQLRDLAKQAFAQLG